MSGGQRPPGTPLAPLDRARQISQALSDAARMARFSTRRKGRYGQQGGFAARKGETLYRIFFVTSFTLMVAIPAIVAAAYYAFFASNQYISEARFSVTISQPPQIDGLANFTGLASVAIIRDTQIVTNYITSRAAVEALERRIGLRERYSRETYDWWARFDATKPIEKFVRYWEGVASTTISMPAGIVNLKVRAFTPDEAHLIASTIVKLSEELINEQNERIFQDAITTAADELKRATARLTAARLALERARVDSGVLDTGRTADALTKLLTELRGSLLTLQQEFTSRSRFVSADAPQMRVLAERIKALQEQVREMDQRLVNPGGDGSQTVSTMMTRFGELDLEKTIAEKLYASAAASLESARLLSEQRRMYLNAFVQPSTPEESRYPRRLLMTFLIALGALSAWGMLLGLVSLMRNHAG
jgi:capsular polysaccharide transport system permease protein